MKNRFAGHVWGLLAVWAWAARISVPAVVAADDISGLVEKVRLGVVLVKTDRGSGTGWIADSTGRVITNYHVIAHSESCRVIYKSAGGGEKGDTVDAKILAVDPKRDLAVLQLPAPRSNRSGWTSLPTGETVSPKAGESVFVIGNPGMGGELLEDTVTSGIISNPAQPIDGRDLIQVTAPINPGNSGGPLFNREGVVIGVVTLKGLRVEGIGFASHVKESVDLLAHADQKPFKVSGSLKDWEKRFAGDVFIEAPGSFIPIDLPHPARGLAWHPGSSRLLVLDPEGNQIHIVNPAKGEIEKSLFAGADPAFFDLQGDTAVVAGPSGRSLRWINVRTGKEEGKSDLPAPPVALAAVESKTAVAALSNGDLVLVSRSKAPETIDGVALAQGAAGLAYDPSSRILYVGQTIKGELSLWAVDLRRLGASKKKGGESCVQDVKVRSREFGESILRPSLVLSKAQKRVFCGGMAFDARTLAPSGQVKRYEMDRKELLQVAALKDLARCPEVVFTASPDGRVLVGPFHLFDAASLTLIRETPFPFQTAAFDPEGKTFFVANPVVPIVYSVPFQTLLEGR